jgi:hypothetical protein
MPDNVDEILKNDMNYGLAVIPKACLDTGKLRLEPTDLLHVVLLDDPPTQGHAQSLADQLRKSKELPIPVDDCVIIPLDEPMVNLIKDKI